MFTFALAGLGIWISASLSGGAEELSTLLLSFSMAALFVLGVGTVFALGGAENAKQKALESSSFLRATSKVVTETHVDAFRAIVLSTPLTLLIPIMLFLSVINQFVRRFVNTSQRGFSMDEIAPRIGSLARRERVFVLRFGMAMDGYFHQFTLLDMSVSLFECSSRDVYGCIPVVVAE